jgi:hypothetical protein
MSIPFVYLCLMSHDTLLSVRWERLFDDLEAQLEAGERDELAAEISDRTRSETARIRLSDRLRQALGVNVELTIAGAGTLSGVVVRVGQGWLLLDTATRPEVLITEPGLFALRGLPVAATDSAAIGAVESRLDLGHVLRAIARDRAALTVMLRDGSSCVGTIDRVGADFVDVAEHAADEPRRASNVTAIRTVAFSAVSLLRPR